MFSVVLKFNTVAKAALQWIIAVFVGFFISCRVSDPDSKYFSLFPNFSPSFSSLWFPGQMIYDIEELPPLLSGLGFPCFRKIRLGWTEWREHRMRGGWWEDNREDTKKDESRLLGKPWMLQRWESWRLIAWWVLPLNVFHRQVFM